MLSQIVLGAGVACLGIGRAYAGDMLKLPIYSSLVNATKPNAPLNLTSLAVWTTVVAGDDQAFSNVLVDTGSAILWVGADQKYKPGPNTQIINETFSVGYGAGGVNGTAYKDKVTIGSATVDSQIIGSAEFLEGFVELYPFDGIFGLGPPGSNFGQVSGHNTTPTFVENLVSEGVIPEPVFGIYLPPFSADGINVGEVTFGGFDPSRYEGEIEWIERNPPFNLHYDFNVSSFSWGNFTAPQPIYGRTDSGTLPILIPNDQLFDILHNVSGAQLDDGENSFLASCLVLPANLTESELPPLEIGVGDLTVSLAPNDYIVPESLFPRLNITEDGLTHTWMCAGGPSFVMLGQIVLEHLYSTYNFTDNRVGFAHSRP